jgi:hypothetical protein
MNMPHQFPTPPGLFLSIAGLLLSATAWGPTMGRTAEPADYRVDFRYDLHLLEGMPAAWAKPGGVNRLKDMPTEFGPLSLEVRIAEDGRTAQLRLDPPTRTPPEHILLHVGCWTGSLDTKAVVELPAAGPIEKTITLANY